MIINILIEENMYTGMAIDSVYEKEEDAKACMSNVKEESNNQKIHNNYTIKQEGLWEPKVEEWEPEESEIKSYKGKPVFIVVVNDLLKRKQSIWKVFTDLYEAMDCQYELEDTVDLNRSEPEIRVDIVEKIVQ